MSVTYSMTRDTRNIYYASGRHPLCLDLGFVDWRYFVLLNSKIWMNPIQNNSFEKPPLPCSYTAINLRTSLGIKGTS